jgi:hypothetical protein
MMGPWTRSVTGTRTLLPAITSAGRGSRLSLASAAVVGRCLSARRRDGITSAEPVIGAQGRQVFRERPWKRRRDEPPLLSFGFVGLTERLLLRRIRRFIPANAHVLAVEVAMANPIDDEHPTPVVLTDKGLLLVTSVGGTAVVTPVPFDRISEARAEGIVLEIGFLDELDRPRTFYADFRRGGDQIIGQFFEALRQARGDHGAEDEGVPVKTFHVAWDHGRGATFDMFDEPGYKRIQPTYDSGDRC